MNESQSKGRMLRGGESMSYNSVANITLLNVNSKRELLKEEVKQLADKIEINHR